MVARSMGDEVNEGMRDRPYSPFAHSHASPNFPRFPLTALSHFRALPCIPWKLLLSPFAVVRVFRG